MKAKAKGYTLVELMIVVAIIGIIVAILLPAYEKHQKEKEVAESTKKK